MEWIETNPLPMVCQECQQQEEIDDCGSCEYAGERWFLSRNDRLLLEKKAAENAIRHFQRRIAAIDKELSD